MSIGFLGLLICLSTVLSFPTPDHSNIYNHAPVSYQYGYSLKDDISGANYGASEKRKGSYAKGKYFVFLPDGRLQTVNYHVDEHSGYVANVAYSGVAHHGGPSFQAHHKGVQEYHPTIGHDHSHEASHQYQLEEEHESSHTHPHSHGGHEINQVGPQSLSTHPSLHPFPHFDQHQTHSSHDQNVFPAYPGGNLASHAGHPIDVQVFPGTHPSQFLPTQTNNLVHGSQSGTSTHSNNLQASYPNNNQIFQNNFNGDLSNTSPPIFTQNEYSVSHHPSLEGPYFISSGPESGTLSTSPPIVPIQSYAVHGQPSSFNPHFANTVQTLPLHTSPPINPQGGYTIINPTGQHFGNSFPSISLTPFPRKPVNTPVQTLGPQFSSGVYHNGQTIVHPVSIKPISHPNSFHQTVQHNQPEHLEHNEDLNQVGEDIFGPGVTVFPPQKVVQITGKIVNEDGNIFDNGDANLANYFKPASGETAFTTEIIDEVHEDHQNDKIFD